MHTISLFWIAYSAGLICLHPTFAERDGVEPPAPSDDLPMDAWLRLPEMERAAIVAGYSKRRIAPRFIDTHERRRQTTIAPGL